MRKRWIMLLLAAAAVIAALPAGIGWVARDRVNSALDEQWPEASRRWSPGWLRSAVQIASPDGEADLTIDHFSTAPPGWLSATGRLRAERPPMVVDATGHLGWRGDFVLRFDADALEIPGPPRWHYRAPDLIVEGRVGEGAATRFRTPALSIHDPAGNVLELRDVELALSLQRVPDERMDVSLTLQTSRPGQPDSRLQLRFNGLDREALAQLIDALRALSARNPESATGRLAQLGVLGAWQQLADAGFTVALDPLRLDGTFEVEGRWHPGQAPRIRGGGSRETLRRWITDLVGLQLQLPPRLAAEQVDVWLQQAMERGWIRLQQDRIEIATTLEDGIDGPPAGS